MAIDSETRTHIDACRRGLPQSLGEREVVFGFDGVVDRIRTAVATRQNSENYERMDSLEAFGTRITDAAAQDSSCSIEWICERNRAGGHTAHLGRAMERLSQQPTIIGTFGTPPREVFTEEYDHTELISLGSAPVTDAIEFDDGKVLLSDTQRLATLDWEEILSTVDLHSLAASIDGAELLGLGYWATIPRMPSIWEGLRDDLWPRLRDPPNRILVDPADVRRLAQKTLVEGVRPLSDLDNVVPVTVSANRAEAHHLLNALDTDTGDQSLCGVAAALRDTLDISTVVVHAASEAALATTHDRYRVVIPRDPEPALTTSAGDHFNAGLVLAELADIDGGGRIAAGSAVAGWFVRNGYPPKYDEFLGFLDRYETLFE
ncbi:MAG TPA: hypothetical protein VFJ06_08675 [Halococcus sp.]|nr:hypothetical protein [Halococcus sp.]